MIHASALIATQELFLAGGRQSEEGGGRWH